MRLFLFRRVSLLVPVFLVGVGLLYFYAKMYVGSEMKQEYLFSLLDKPFSCDPIEHDPFVHHALCRSVQSTLVSAYNIQNSYTGILAEKWSTSPDLKVWTFVVRPSLSFEDGQAILPSTIKNSWTRLAYLMAKRKSHSAFFDALESGNYARSPTEGLTSIDADDTHRTLTIRLSKPEPTLLDIVGFGVYAVVSQKDYDSESGEWLAKNRLTSSGFYRIQSWTDDAIVLVLRRDFIPDFIAPNSVQKWKIVWADSDPQVDLQMGSSFEGSRHPGRRFYSGAENQIDYIRIFSASKDGPLADRKVRKSLRNLFYKVSEQHLGRKLPKSFFPLAMSGVKENALVDDTSLDTSLLAGTKLTINLKKNSSLFLAPKLLSIFEEVCSKVGAKFATTEFSYQETLKYNPAGLPSYPFEFAMRGTGISIQDPAADIRFMFLSKEGIELPDDDGSISGELKKEAFDTQKINEMIWDQALVWPVFHYADGLWASSSLDLSLVNTLKPPTELIWIRWKN